MGGRAGGGAAGGMGNASRSRFAKIPGLQAIQDAKLRNEIISALEDYEKEFGVRLENISLSKLKGNVGGETYYKDKIILNSKVFTTSDNVKAVMKGAYDTGLLTKTNSPLRHIMVHELAHATWTPGYKTSNKAAQKEILGAYRKFLKDSSAKGWGSYSKSHYTEFFAEAVAKHMYGAKDAHTQAVADIIKKYKL